MKVLILRPEEECAESARAAQELGLEPVIVPAVSIRILPVSADEIVHSIESSGLLVFLSSRSVRLLVRVIGTFRSFSGRTVISVGKATRSELERHGVASVLPAVHSSSGVADMILSDYRDAGGVAVFRSASGSSVLREKLASSGISVKEICLYDTVPAADTARLSAAIRDISEGKRYIVPFTSSNVVKSVFARAASMGLTERLIAGLEGCIVLSIGRETSAELRRRDVPFTESADTDFTEMLRAAMRLL
ncbi:MAG: uroporphyrinogen-III synthase [Thermoplasmata archaeon]|uniref:Uroporphyrinogen-III synthase n=1 Tax=Candidatus Sysuiplasma superficiale TaxID=2823368 RepID=A0A8J8CC37_9ARCH|nr:uroporphyrinogen-III synthase [Candidatus Sysuiplasma superficiale]MBX8643254.1 uroporphyrinogen-III synthase [Candidatus Sysuiplasma superficiale]MCL4346977.1 uroporphyrinogen-III synthase [Candidatus Thermoplasmatota archaeon]MCL5437477.1 uroporphyrinogen-III synthase [Candidatus Thermoplasmatota archaeon]